MNQDGKRHKIKKVEKKKDRNFEDTLKTLANIDAFAAGFCTLASGYMLGMMTTANIAEPVLTVPTMISSGVVSVAFLAASVSLAKSSYDNNAKRAILEELKALANKKLLEEEEKRSR